MNRKVDERLREDDEERYIDVAATPESNARAANNDNEVAWDQ